MPEKLESCLHIIDKTQSVLNTCEIHGKRLNTAYQKVSDLFPLTANRVQQVTDENLGYLELLTSRFCKLQDLIGSQLLACVIELGGVTAPGTAIDKINYLEKLGLPISVALWRELRERRNDATHEYPTEPDLLAAGLNRVYSATPQLLAIYSALKNFAQSLLRTSP